MKMQNRGGLWIKTETAGLISRSFIISLVLILAISTSCYAVNIFDRVLYKKVILCANHMYVLVNRITGEVKYILQNGRWVLLTGVLKNQCQSMYQAQIKLKLVCRN